MVAVAVRVLALSLQASSKADMTTGYQQLGGSDSRQDKLRTVRLGNQETGAKKEPFVNR
jgi:hypothetical protein